METTTWRPPEPPRRCARARTPGARGLCFVYGFDDLTVEQLELLSALAEASEVTVSVAYEDRDAFVARAHLYQELRERGGESEPPLEPNPANTESQTLFRARALLAARADRSDRAGRRPGADGGGRRARSGRADRWRDRSPARRRGEARRDRGRASVPRSPRPPVRERAGGLRRPGGGRGPRARRPHGGRARADRAAARGADLAARRGRARVRAHAGGRPRGRRGLARARHAPAGAADRGRGARGLDAAGPCSSSRSSAKRRQPDELLRVVAGLARRIGEQPHERQAPLAAREERLELRAAASRPRPSRPWPRCPTSKTPPERLSPPWRRLEVPLWRGPTEGHVRVTSPYRIRARRVTHLFVASLQEGEFPRHDAGEPFLSDEQRGALGLPPRARADDEERYLFHVCLSRPTRRLYLCWRSCDDEGAEAARSPFLDDVRRSARPTATRPAETRILSTASSSGAGSATSPSPLARRRASTSWPAPSPPPRSPGTTARRRRPSSGSSPTTPGDWRPGWRRRPPGSGGSAWNRGR